MNQTQTEYKTKSEYKTQGVYETQYSLNGNVISLPKGAKTGGKNSVLVLNVTKNQDPRISMRPQYTKDHLCRIIFPIIQKG